MHRSVLSTFRLSAADGASLHVYRWETVSTPRAVVQIAHGLAEHAGRYAQLAGELNEAGYAVYANDHRGHGLTAPSQADLGFFAERDGWEKCVNDLELLRRRISCDHPGIPLVLLGHSMGSFLARDHVTRHADGLAGLVLSATDGKPSLLARAGRLIARLERLRLGPRGQSDLIHTLSFGAFNKPFEPGRTSCDWLSRDPAAVDAYRADPFCGFRPTVQLWIDLLDAVDALARPDHALRIPKPLPIHVISGGDDSVSGNARGVERLLAEYMRVGLTRVSSRIYPGARHELFHEINREEVVRDLLVWLDRTLASTPA